MSALSNSIEQFIKSMMSDNEDELELQRNELAHYFKCAPSHINYVLSTRFTIERGYTVQSRRGGGGYIRIMRIDVDKDGRLYTVLTEEIGDALDQKGAAEIIDALESCKVVTPREARLMKAATRDKTILAQAPVRNTIRAHILKAQVLELLNMKKEEEA